MNEFIQKAQKQLAIDLANVQVMRELDDFVARHKRNQKIIDDLKRDCGAK